MATFTEFTLVLFTDGRKEILCDACVAVARKYGETRGAIHQGVFASEIQAPVKCDGCSNVLTPVKSEARV